MAGRISIDVDPKDHLQLKAILAAKGVTINKWFQEHMRKLFEQERKRG